MWKQGLKGRGACKYIVALRWKIWTKVAEEKANMFFFKVLQAQWTFGWGHIFMASQANFRSRHREVLCAGCRCISLQHPELSCKAGRKGQEGELKEGSEC